jgi:hypothetical protein
MEKNMEERKVLKDILKHSIEDTEYYANGFQRLCGAYARATKIRVNKKGDKVTANITLFNGDHKETYADCEYKLIKLLQHHEKSLEKHADAHPTPLL